LKKKKIIIAAFVVLLLGVGLMVWFGQQSLKKDGLYYSGTVEAATISNLSFQVGGKVVKVLVTEGQRVEKDQPLAELDRAEFEAARDQSGPGGGAFGGLPQDPAR
jgi:HlyD family secretion protein